MAPCLWSKGIMAHFLQVLDLCIIKVTCQLLIFFSHVMREKKSVIENNDNFETEKYLS